MSDVGNVMDVGEEEVGGVVVAPSIADKADEGSSEWADELDTRKSSEADVVVVPSTYGFVPPLHVAIVENGGVSRHLRTLALACQSVVRKMVRVLMITFATLFMGFGKVAQAGQLAASIVLNKASGITLHKN